MFMDSGVMTTRRRTQALDRRVHDDGRLLVDQVAMIATWQGSSQRRPMTGLNQPAGPEGVSLFTSAWGRRRRPRTTRSRSSLNSFPPVAPLTDLTGTVVAQARGRHADPAGRRRPRRRGASAGRLASERRGRTAGHDPRRPPPQWSDVADASGRGR
jgi:hypothetical protein